MRFATTLACFISFAPGFAQDSTNLEAIVYPRLARAARVQGDVLIADGTVVAGPPLLRQAALRSVPLLGQHNSKTNFLFHFILLDTVGTKTERVKKGNAFDRFFLRIIGASVVRTIERCDNNIPPPEPRVRSMENLVEVWVYAAGMCLNTQTVTLARS
jgi:hypothetical protein